jgi:hypothetical protein
MKITKGHLRQFILSEAHSLFERKKKKDPGAKVRNRGDAIFPAGSKSVNDDEDHFPINSLKQARNALSQASKYKKKPSWFNGSLKKLVTTVQRKVRAKYPSIETTKASARPGKG